MVKLFRVALTIESALILRHPTFILGLLIFVLTSLLATVFSFPERELSRSFVGTAILWIFGLFAALSVPSDRFSSDSMPATVRLWRRAGRLRSLFWMIFIPRLLLLQALHLLAILLALLFGILPTTTELCTLAAVFFVADIALLSLGLLIASLQLRARSPALFGLTALPFMIPVLLLGAPLAHSAAGALPLDSRSLVFLAALGVLYGMIAPELFSFVAED